MNNIEKKYSPGPSEDINKSKCLAKKTESSDLDVSEILQKANAVLICDGEIFHCQVQIVSSF